MTLRRWLGVYLQQVNRCRFLAMCGPEAVGSRIPAANDYDALAGRQDGFSRPEGIACTALILLGQVGHSKVNAFQIPTRYRNVSMLLRTHGQEHCIESAD